MFVYMTEALSVSAEAGFVWQADEVGISRFLAHAEAEFPVYFQHSVFILGDWKDWESLKVCPVPPPECEMLCLGDAALLLLV